MVVDNLLKEFDRLTQKVQMSRISLEILLVGEQSMETELNCFITALMSSRV